jgi:hypothetical protein
MQVSRMGDPKLKKAAAFNAIVAAQEHLRRTEAGGATPQGGEGGRIDGMEEGADAGKRPSDRVDAARRRASGPGANAGAGKAKDDGKR